MTPLEKSAQNLIDLISDKITADTEGLEGIPVYILEQFGAIDENTKVVAIWEPDYSAYSINEHLIQDAINLLMNTGGPLSKSKMFIHKYPIRPSAYKPKTSALKVVTGEPEGEKFYISVIEPQQFKKRANSYMIQRSGVSSVQITFDSEIDNFALVFVEDTGVKKIEIKKRIAKILSPLIVQNTNTGFFNKSKKSVLRGHFVSDDAFHRSLAETRKVIKEYFTINFDQKKKTYQLRKNDQSMTNLS